MDVALEMLDVLARRYAFGEVAALVASGVCAGRRTEFQTAQIQQLCAFGARLLDLDAEDFGKADAATGANTDHSFADRVTGDAVPADLVARSRHSRMPQSANEPDRGALQSLQPVYSLLLEVIAVRWLRRETSSLVAALHVTAEYLPLLIWEHALGHAGDPVRMPHSVGGDASLWGASNRDCPHTNPLRSAAERVLRVAREPDPGWCAYLDRQHSMVSRALAMCAAGCRTPCTVLTRHPAPEREHLAVACRAAEEFSVSAIIRLRHSAPVGHGFGVPSPAEVREAWTHSRTVLSRYEPAVLAEDGFPLPGLANMLSALAGVTIRPDTLIADTVTSIRQALVLPPARLV